MEILDLNALIQRLRHVIHRERGDGGGRQGFHFDSGGSGGCHLGGYTDPARFHLGGHVHMLQEQRVAHGNQLPGALGGANSSETSYFERIALGIFGQLFEHTGLNPHKSVCGRGAARFGLGRHVHHLGPALFVIVRESFWLHFRRTRMSSQAAQCSRSASATRKALARVRAGTSPEPCQDSGVTLDPSALILAGRKRVNPGLWRKSQVSEARSRGSGDSVAPDRSSTAARAKISKVTMVEAGLPGSPKNCFPRASPKTTGWPGWIFTRSK